MMKFAPWENNNVMNSFYYTTTISSHKFLFLSDFSWQDFCPEKYKGLCKIMCNKFIKTGDASSMLEAYLSVVTKGSCPNDENGLFLVKDFDPRLSYVASPISGKFLIYWQLSVHVDCFSSQSVLVCSSLINVY